MPRKKVDLRTLPRWAQYAIALSVVALIVWMAQASPGFEKPIPRWAQRWLLPVLGWAFIVACAYAISKRIRRRK